MLHCTQKYLVKVFPCFQGGELKRLCAKIDIVELVKISNDRGKLGIMLKNRDLMTTIRTKLYIVHINRRSIQWKS